VSAWRQGALLRQALAVATALLIAAGVVAVGTQPEPARAEDVPILRAAPRTTTTTPPPSTTVVPPPEPPAPTTTTVRPTTPIDVPADEYAPEPIQEIGTIEIPKIGLRHRVMNGITMRNIDLGPSHWPGTAMPGEVGNTVFAGHRVTKTKPFRNIDQLVPGDEVIFDIGGRRSVYTVTGSKVVLPTALEIVDPTPTATGTLFACHPPGSARYRYVVLLALVEPPPPAANTSAGPEPPPAADSSG
jgi:sortase A